MMAPRRSGEALAIRRRVRRRGAFAVVAAVHGWLCICMLLGSGRAWAGPVADPSRPKAVAEAIRKGYAQSHYYHNWGKALHHYLVAYRLAPRDSLVQGRLEEAFSKNFALPIAQVRSARQRGQLWGRLASLPPKKQVDFAIDELLLEHHRYGPKCDRPGVPYLDMRRLLLRYFVPTILAANKELLAVACAHMLRADGKRSGARDVQRVLGKTPCTAYQLDLQVGRILRDPEMRFVLIRNLAPQATHPKEILQRAARKMLPLIGADISPICWKEAKVSGTGCKCATSLGKAKGYPKPSERSLTRFPVLGYAVRSRVPATNMVRSALAAGMRFYKQAGIGAAELKRLRDRSRRARNYRCFVQGGEIYRERAGRRWGPLQITVGNSTDQVRWKEVGCKRFPRVALLLRLGRTLRSATRKVVGGKYDGRWEIEYKKVVVRGKVVNKPEAKTRRVVIYFHRTY